MAPRRYTIGVAAVLVIGALCEAARGQAGYFGTARININPSTPIMLSGYAARSSLGEASNVQQSIFAQAAAFGTGADAALIVAVDAAGLPKSIVDPLIAKLGANYGVAADRIAFTSTHSHSCPHCAGFVPNLFNPPLSTLKQQHVNQYTAELTAKLEQVAVSALNNRSPGHQLAWGVGSVGFGQNRRGMPVAPNDHDLPVMRVTDSTGATKAILTSYATHAVTLNANDNLVSGDWPGYARQAIEAAYPGATALVMIGAGGDSNPNALGSASAAQMHGQSVANEVQRLINQQLLTPTSSSIASHHSETSLSFATQRLPGDPTSARLASAPASTSYGITSWSFGDDLAMVFMEGEVVADYSLRLKAELGDRLWVNAYANDVQGYIPSERILYEGGYEADDSGFYYGLPGRFAHGIEDKIVDVVHNQLAEFTNSSDRLQLAIDWSTGAAAIQNVTGHEAHFEAYTIESRAGGLGVGNAAWRSLQDQNIAGWDEADNANASRLTEFNPTGDLVLPAGGAVSLGRPFAPHSPTALGQQPLAPEITFCYSEPGAGTRAGNIVYGGRANNVVLTIDPATGEAALRNESVFFDAEIDGYSIASAAGRLIAADSGWDSLDDQGLAGWDEADNSSNFRLTEFNPSNSTLLAKDGAALHLGAIVDVSAGRLAVEDLKIKVSLEAGGELEGIVRLGHLPAASTSGDFDGDADADGADFLAWQRTRGGLALPFGGGADANRDGVIDNLDLAQWQLSDASSAMQQVPEPGLNGMAILATCHVVAKDRRRKVKSLLTPLGILLLISCFRPTSCRAADDVYDVGVAKVDVTPAYPVRLNGFGFRREESEGVTQRIWVKTLAIGSDEQKPLVLAAVDATGIPAWMVKEVAQRLHEAAGIAPERFAVTFTHSHTSPKLNGVCDTVFSTPIPPEHQAHIDRYTKEMTEALLKAATAALADRQPARLFWTKGQVGFAMNRRTPGGPVDHDLPVMVVKSPAGDVRAIYANYACHCVTLSNNKVSGDWAGFAQAAIERKHPGAVALVSIGCGSDSNPSSGVTGDNTAAAAEQGDEIAAEVDRLLRTELRPIHGATSATLSNIPLPFKKLPSRSELDALAKQDDAAGYNAKFQLARLERGEALPAEIAYPIQCWTFGDSFAMAFLGGEICVDYAIRFKDDFDASRLWLNGYSNDLCAYIPSERLLREGGYGGGAEVVYFALPTTFAAGLEEKIVAEVHRQLPAEFLRPEKSKDANRGSLSPVDSLASLHVGPGLAVELAAAEPLVESPVAIDFGPDGRLWVAEMRDYSREVEDRFKQTGAVKSLIDRDGDGQFDQATTVVAGLRFPTDVKAWKDGVIVCDAPSVTYFEDADGDGTAEVRQELLAGFATHNPQARVNSLRWGLDNWLYGSCGLFGGHIKSFSGREVELSACDFRFRPDTGEIEAVTGRTQQGRTRDDWGNWFGCENSVLLKHYPLSDAYLRRNPFVTPPPVEIHVAAGADAERLFPVGAPTLLAQSGPPGRPTSACGAEIYRDELLGPAYAGSAFVAEPVNHLVHRLELTPRGATFDGRRADAEQDREFLASADPWFRPVQVRTGLDGCLWIVDMHRATIEHPRFIARDVLAKLDPLAGSASGRIFRVKPAGAPPRQPPMLAKLDDAALVTALDTPNGPQRDLVQQLLVARRAFAVAPKLEQLARQAERPEVRLQALCTLDGVGGLTPSALATALADPHPAVRSHGVRLSERRVNDAPEILNAWLRLIDDKATPVALQLAYSLGSSHDKRAAAALAKLAARHAQDPYVLAAALSSASAANVSDFVEGVMGQASDEKVSPELLKGALTAASKLGDEACRGRVLHWLGRSEKGELEPWRLAALATFFHAMSPEQLAKLENRPPAGAGRIENVIAAAGRTANRNKTDDDSRIAALAILQSLPSANSKALQIARGWLKPRFSPTLQRAAVEALARDGNKQAAADLLAGWAEYGPATRGIVLECLVSRDALLPALLESLKAGVVKPGDLDAASRERLLQHADQTIRAVAETALAGAIDADRQKVVERYLPATNQRGESAHGRELFAKHCAACHQLDGVGFAVGPDLAALTVRTIPALVESILDPNRSIDERYQCYAAASDDGLSHTGILIRETSTSVTLLEQQGKERTILRESLESLRNTGQSLMPTGLERDLAPSDLADLLAFLSDQWTPPKKLPGNSPALVRPDADGALALRAAEASIYGGEIVFEQPFQNIGFWHGEDDHVAWDVEVNLPGAYVAHLAWACAADSAGNAAVLEADGSAMKFTVADTGGYDRYQVQPLGRLPLRTGRQRIVLRPDGPLRRTNLMDLRAVYLVPPGVSNARVLAEHDQLATATTPATAGAADEIARLVSGLATGTPAEYEQIPAIWRVAIAAGRRNDADELTAVIRGALPEGEAPLEHWQAVVLGGGVINGVSAAGGWPAPRLAELVAAEPALRQRWERSIELASSMADDAAVHAGTRYDALRMLGAAPYERHGAQLAKYLADKNAELQMGAVSALADVESNEATKQLIAHFTNLTGDNRNLAFAALLRTPDRTTALVDALESGRLPRSALTSANRKQLNELTDTRLRSRVRAALDAPSNPRGSP